MAIRQKPENTIEFSEKGITIYLTKAIYDALPSFQLHSTENKLYPEWLL